MIDADLRRPALHKVFRIETASGLADGLDPAGDKPRSSCRQVTPTLSLAAGGPAHRRSDGGPDSPNACGRLIDEAREMFDWVIIDTPPLDAAAGREPAGVDGRCRGARGQSRIDAARDGQARDGGDRPITGSSASCSTSATVGAHGGYDGYGYDYSAPVPQDARRRESAKCSAITRVLTVRSVGAGRLRDLLIVAAIASAAFVRFGGDAPEFIALTTAFVKFLVVAAVLQACLYYADLYNLRRSPTAASCSSGSCRRSRRPRSSWRALYYWFPSLDHRPRRVRRRGAGSRRRDSGWRLLFEWLSRNMRPRERLLLVGTSAAAVDLARELFERRHELGVEIVGFVDPDPARVGAPVLNPGVIGTIEDIPSIVRARGVDRVVVSLADARGKLPMDKLLEMKLDGVTFDHLASVYEEYTGKIAVENLRPSWLIFSPGFRKTRLLSATKRLLDIVDRRRRPGARAAR